LADHQHLIAVALGDASTSYERRNAIAALGELDDPLTLNTLVQLLNVDDRYVRRDVVKAIGTHGSDSAVLALINCLGDDTDNIRRDAASVLAHRNDGRAIPALKKLLEDKGYAVRHAAESAIELLEREGIEPIEVDAAVLEGFSASANHATTEPQRDRNDSQTVQSAADTDAAEHNAADATPSAVDHSQAEPRAEKTHQTKNHEQDAAIAIETEWAQARQETRTSDASRTVDGETEAESVAEEESPAGAGNSQNDNETSSDNTSSVPPEEGVASDLASMATTNVQKPGNESVSAQADNTGEPAPRSGNESDSEPNAFGAGILREPTSEEEVLLAELVQTAPAKNAHHELPELADYEQQLDPVAWETMVLPTPPAHFQWSNAKRFVGFFEDELDDVAKLYDQLSKRQANVMDTDIALEKALLRHDLVYADLADDLETARESRKEHDNACQELQEAMSSLAATLSLTRRSNTGFLSSLANTLWPLRLKALTTLENNLNSKMRELGSSVEDSEHKLAAAQEQERSVSTPMKDVDQELLSANDASTIANNELNLVRIQINQAILKVINSESKNGFTRRVDSLVNQSSCGISLRQCFQEIQQHQAEQKVLVGEMLELESPLNEDVVQFANSTNEVAKAVTDGFVHRSRDRKLKTQVNCAVAFRSASTSTGTTHRLIGQAQGQANLSVNYQIEQIEWKGGEKLRMSLEGLSKSVTRIGSLQALHAIRTAEIAAASSSLNDCVSFIRFELEQDFGVMR
jgi:hypothetical protein